MTQYPCKGCLLITICSELCSHVLKLLSIYTFDVKHDKDIECILCGNKLYLRQITSTIPYHVDEELKCTVCPYKRFMGRYPFHLDKRLR